MSINNFSSYFEIFAVLNLAYTGSKIFREGVNDEILSYRNAVNAKAKNRINELKAIITVAEFSEEFTLTIDKALRSLEIRLDAETEVVLKREMRDRNFVYGLKAMFLATSLYCFALIILGGLEQFIQDVWVVSLCIIVLSITLLFNAAVFVRSFTDRFSDGMLTLYPIGMIFVAGLFSYYTVNACPSHIVPLIGTYLEGKKVALLSLFVAVSPYIFHFSKVWHHKWFYRRMINAVITDVNNGINKSTSTIELLVEHKDS